MLDCSGLVRAVPVRVLESGEDHRFNGSSYGYLGEEEKPESPTGLGEPARGEIPFKPPSGSYVIASPQRAETRQTFTAGMPRERFEERCHWTDSFFAPASMHSKFTPKAAALAVRAKRCSAK